MANILLVDDDAFVVGILQDAIKSKGHTVETAFDGVEAIVKFSANHFDLVITDIIMPEMEGIDVIRKMRLHAPKTKIIAISGGGRKGNPAYLKMAKEFGAAATLDKPIQLTKLYDVLDACLI